MNSCILSLSSVVGRQNRQDLLCWECRIADRSVFERQGSGTWMSPTLGQGGYNNDWSGYHRQGSSTGVRTFEETAGWADMRCCGSSSQLCLFAEGYSIKKSILTFVLILRTSLEIIGLCFRASKVVAA